MEYPKHQTQLSDEAIIELFWRREESAIPETDRKYGTYLYAIAFNILKNREDCEECLNDTYLKTWKRQKRIPPELCDPLADGLEVLLSDTDLHREMESREIGRVISSYLDSVSDKKLYIFMSRYFFLMPLEEIAKKVGCSLSTVNKTLASMKKELKKRLEKEGIEV